MSNKLKKLRNVIREVIEEETQYEKFFQKALNKFGYDSPAEMSDSTKKKFFDYVDSNWKADNESPDSQTQFDIFFKKALKKFNVDSPADFKSTEKKKEFFDYVDANWKADDETSESKGIQNESKSDQYLRDAFYSLGDAIGDLEQALSHGTSPTTSKKVEDDNKLRSLHSTFKKLHIELKKHLDKTYKRWD